MTDGRYQLFEPIGRGVMGIVHRAYDRLEGQIVALKHIDLSLEQIDLSLGSRAQHISTLRLALAQEFQLLAGLRHPHIISVLDYGFNQEKQPFYVMSYLSDSQTILEAGATGDLSYKLGLIRQTLEALAYLHRRKIIHRDIKPTNILVSENQVKLLDFGLSLPKHKVDTATGGPLFYLAPELLEENGEPSEASDLYAVGVTAYQLLAGHHPFDVESPDFSKQVLESDPDLSALNVSEPLGEVIGKLLSKSPADRFESAQLTLQAIAEALGESPPPESDVIRESYLQAAEFVGREKEIGLLQVALRQAIMGEGSAWLIGGETGVGKSRLVRELQTLALVEGFLVLKGKGIQGEGGLSYQVWRDPLRHLILTSNTIDDLSAGVLMPLIPDIDRLLGREVNPPPKVDEEASLIRLFTTISRLVQQQRRPIIIILEDLHLVNRSLSLLPFIARQCSSLPLIVVATYRNDERSELPVTLKEMKLMMLERLKKEDVAVLAASMLGEVGDQPDLVARLHKETEGNALFLVEVVRSLAQQTGRLEDIADEEWQTPLLPDGILTIIDQRLARIMPSEQNLLRITAVAGREIDLTLLHELDDSKAVNRLLSLCAEANILEVQNGQWHFTHEKIRERILAQIPTDQLSAYHRKIAELIEKCYPNEIQRAVSLTFHWGEAGDLEKARFYAQKAGRYACDRFAHHEAIVFLERAITLTEDPHERFDLLYLREASCNALGNRVEQERDLARLAELAAKVGTPEDRAKVTLRYSHWAQVTGKYKIAISMAQEVVRTGAAMANIKLHAEGRLAWGIALFHQGQTAAAVAQFDQAAALCRYSELEETLILALLGCANGYFRQGKYDMAETLSTEALELSERLNFKRYQAEALDRLAETAVHRGIQEKAREYMKDALQIIEQLGLRCLEGDLHRTLSLTYFWEQQFDSALRHGRMAHKIFQEVGDRQNESRLWNILGIIFQVMGDHYKAYLHFKASLLMAHEMQVAWTLEAAHSNIAGSLLMMGMVDKAQFHLKESLHFNQSSKNGQAKGFTLFRRGLLYFFDEEFVEAEKQFKETLAYLEEVPSPMISAFTHLFLGNVHLNCEENATAEAHFQQALAAATDLNHKGIQIGSAAGLAYLAAVGGEKSTVKHHLDQFQFYQKSYPLLAGVLHPGSVWHQAIRAAQLIGDSRKRSIARQAAEWFKRRQAEIGDAKFARSFAENVPVHRQLQSLLYTLGVR